MIANSTHFVNFGERYSRKSTYFRELAEFMVFKTINLKEFVVLNTIN